QSEDEAHRTTNTIQVHAGLLGSWIISVLGAWSLVPRSVRGPLSSVRTKDQAIRTKDLEARYAVCWAGGGCHMRQMARASAALSALLWIIVPATVALPANASAQDAKTVVEGTLRAMGAANLNAIV